MDLKQFFKEHPRAAIAFSGGTDSALLLWAARKYADRVCAYYVKTAFQPEFELHDAKKLAQELCMPLKVLELDILSDLVIASNPKDRCYSCKRCLFTAIAAAANEDGYSLVLDGTNASDDPGDRPGMRALRELQIRSPLAECGLTKEQVRQLSRQAGLFTWEKPAYACLATRFPSGMPLTEEGLSRVEQSEAFLRELGFRDLRLRVWEDRAILQLPREQIQLAAEQYEKINNGLGGEFRQILLDLHPRQPSA